MCIYCPNEFNPKICMRCMKVRNERLRMWCSIESTKPLNFGRGPLKYDNDYIASITGWIMDTVHIFDHEISSPVMPNTLVRWDVIDKLMCGNRT